MPSFVLGIALALQVMRVPVAPAETLRVEREGSGRPVVLIPGLFGSAYGYRRVAALLVTEGRRVIIIEPLAIGGSSRPRTADYSLTAQADRIAAVLDTLGERGAVVVSHAIGTGMAMRLALRRPDLVAMIVSLDGGPAEAAASPGFRRALTLAPLLRLFGGQGVIRGRIRSSLVHSSGDASWVTDEVILRYTEGATADIGATLSAYRAMAASREPMELAPRLGALKCPVVLLIGESPHEGRVSDVEVGLLRRELPVFRLDLVAGAGLYLQEEQPELVARAVLRGADL